MNHLIITGESGAGKSLICESIISQIANDAFLLQFNKENQEHVALQGKLKSGNVVAIIDEQSHQFLDVYGVHEIKKLVSEGLRLAIISRTVDDVATELLAVVAGQGGFRHIAIGLNQVLAGPPQFDTPMAFEKWETLFSTLPVGTVTATAKTILGKWMQELAAASGSAEEKAALMMQFGVLVNAIKIAEFPFGKVGDLPRAVERKKRNRKETSVAA